MCFGPFVRLCHWGPMSALAIIKFVTGVTVYCNSMWWPPGSSHWAFINSLCFMAFSGLTLYNFLSSMYQGPGYLPLNWEPANAEDCKFLQWCGVCRGYKAPRSHHCRKCGRCVLKMDHHCPWINNCVGWGNHAHFITFLLFATLGCTQSTIILICSLYRALHRVHYLYHGTGNEPIVNLNLYGMFFCVFALGFSIGVIIAVGMLLYFQIRAVVRNRTGIEDWIVEKANFRRRNTRDTFQYPYDLGVRENIKEVVNLTCQPVGDGISWPILPGCHQYTLTIEQIEQKSEKRLRTKIYQIIRPASGSWCPIAYGFKVLFCPPYTDEPRIRLEIGDLVSVTRWRKYWLFGEKIQDLPEDDEALLRIRGWFPRPCAIEIRNDYEIKDKKLK